MDPVFGRDVSYYVFTLPQIENLIGYAGAALVDGALRDHLPIYLLRGRITFRPWQLLVEPVVRLHLSLLVTG